MLGVGRECGAVGGVQVVGYGDVTGAGDHDEVVASRQVVHDGGHSELASGGEPRTCISDGEVDDGGALVGAPLDGFGDIVFP